jgi:hypothetical protein
VEHVACVFTVEEEPRKKPAVVTTVYIQFLAALILRPSRWRQHIHPKRQLTFNGLQGISLDIALFINLINFIPHRVLQSLWHLT